MTTCPRHPKVETSLRCAACGTPICPQCLVQTPVGAKCRDCGSQRGVSLFTLGPASAVGAVGASVLAGVVAGWGVEFGLGFVMLFLAFGFGAFAGEMILRASGRKRGLKMELIAGIGMAVGALGGRLLIAAISHLPPAPLGVFQVIADLVTEPIRLAALVIVIFSAVSRIRYL